MHVETAAELRARAAHARHLADEMYNREAQAELRRIAEALDARANELEQAEGHNLMPPGNTRS